MQEASAESASDWKPVAGDISGTDFTVNEISPRKDYNFRIRAEMENGDLTEATPDIQYYRSKVPMSKEPPFQITEHKPVEYETSFANRSYVEHLTKFVPPRMPIDKPEMTLITPDTVELLWRPAREPDSIRSTSNLTYSVEVRYPPNYEWTEIATGLKSLTYTADELHPKIDYVFRVRAWNTYGCSEPCLPVHLNRPIQAEDIEMEEEEWEREWEAEYGYQVEEEEFEDLSKVPPKLPMDTPKTLSQTPDSIWFSWLPARIPAYATQTPITYVVEMKEPPCSQWRRDVIGLVDCQFVREGLDPIKDYCIQVRAETEFGTSDPTLPIIIKGKGSLTGSLTGSRMSSMDRDILGEEVGMNTARLEAITGGVPPRMASSRPKCSNAKADQLTLSWTACRVPSYVKSVGVSYIIEKREPPSHIWTVLARDVTQTQYDITKLNPEFDYMFRVRARNEYGTSEPSLPMCIYRDRDDYVPQKVRSRSGSRDSISLLTSLKRRSISTDFDRPQAIEADPLVEACQRDKKPVQPEYITTTYGTQYGVAGKKGKITLQVRGYPLPTVHWYKGEEKLQYGDDYNAFVTPPGEITLEIKNVTSESEGEYKCYAENESGAAVKVVSYRLTDAPTVIRPLSDVTQSSNMPCILSCQVDGAPEATVKWTKDWQPLAESSRIKAVTLAPETYSLEINNALVTDSGMYACTVENVAGSVTVTSRVVIDETEPFELKLKTVPIEDFYVILEELGRGRNGVVRKVIELSSGRAFAANFMFLRNKAQKNYFLSEFEALSLVRQMDSVLRLHDAFETERGLIFITEILSGPELLEKMVADGDWTEARVAGVIKQLLATLHEFEPFGLLHLDIKPSNIRLQAEDTDLIKLINFGTARFLQPDEEVLHNYGTVGYASPEQIENDVITNTSDLWGVGVLTYILLSGVAPFTGSTDAEVLQKSLKCKWTFDEKAFGKVSPDAKDFVKKLIVKQSSARPRVSEMLKHPWLGTSSDVKINQENLKKFYHAEKLKSSSEAVYTNAQLQSLTKLVHGAAALYQPAVDLESGEIVFPDTNEYGDFLEEDDWYDWQLQYLDDPDSQLYPLHSKDFNIRQGSHLGTAPGNQKKDREEKVEPDTGSSVMFRNKIQPVTFTVGDDVEFSCTVISLSETPVITWYRDDTLLSDAYRVEATFKEETGVAKLKVFNTKDYDAAIYQCVARNKDGRVSCQAPLLVGGKPGRTGRPVVTQTSGSEAFITWSGPVNDGNSYILGYRVDYRATGGEWVKGPYVTEEYALISGLVPDTKYVFRVSCHNKYGTSPYSWASLETTTGGPDSAAVTIATYLQPVLQFASFTKQQLILPAASRRPSLSAPEEAKMNEADPTESYDFGETVSKGAYGEYKMVTNKSTKSPGVAKIVPYAKDKHAEISREFQLLKNLRQFNVITVLEGFVHAESFYTVFERLSGINVVQYLCLSRSYKEGVVVHIIRQVLDALQYIQHFGIAHLNLQPSSIVMATRRRPHVKLRDFSHARVVDDEKGEKVEPVGYPDFVAPEVVRGELVGSSADTWAVGALAFTLLSGASPFAGKDLPETLTNILFDRYNVSDMYDTASKDSVKFINRLLMRLPKNRPTVNKCLTYRWLQYSENMIKSRSSKSFKSERLRDFCTLYQKRRSDPEYMGIAKVSIDTLPKPTVGLEVMPILTQGIAPIADAVPSEADAVKLPLEAEVSQKAATALETTKDKTIKEESVVEKNKQTVASPSANENIDKNVTPEKEEKQKKDDKFDEKQNNEVAAKSDAIKEDTQKKDPKKEEKQMKSDKIDENQNNEVAAKKSDAIKDDTQKKDTMKEKKQIKTDKVDEKPKNEVTAKSDLLKEDTQKKDPKKEEKQMNGDKVEEKQKNEVTAKKNDAIKDDTQKKDAKKEEKQTKSDKIDKKPKNEVTAKKSDAIKDGIQKKDAKKEEKQMKSDKIDEKPKNEVTAKKSDAIKDDTQKKDGKKEEKQLKSDKIDDKPKNEVTAKKSDALKDDTQNENPKTEEKQTKDDKIDEKQNNEVTAKKNDTINNDTEKKLPEKIEKQMKSDNIDEKKSDAIKDDTQTKDALIDKVQSPKEEKEPKDDSTKMSNTKIDETQEKETSQTSEVTTDKNQKETSPTKEVVEEEATQKETSPPKKTENESDEKQIQNDLTKKSENEETQQKDVSPKDNVQKKGENPTETPAAESTKVDTKLEEIDTKVAAPDISKEQNADTKVDDKSSETELKKDEISTAVDLKEECNTIDESNITKQKAENTKEKQHSDEIITSGKDAGGENPKADKSVEETKDDIGAENKEKTKTDDENKTLVNDNKNPNSETEGNVLKSGSEEKPTHGKENEGVTNELVTEPEDIVAKDNVEVLASTPLETNAVESETGVKQLTENTVQEENVVRSETNDSKPVINAESVCEVSDTDKDTLAPANEESGDKPVGNIIDSKLETSIQKETEVEEEIIPSVIKKAECSKEAAVKPKGITNETLSEISDILTSNESNIPNEDAEVDDSPSPVAEDVICPEKKAGVQATQPSAVAEDVICTEKKADVQAQQPTTAEDKKDDKAKVCENIPEVSTVQDDVASEPKVKEASACPDVDQTPVHDEIAEEEVQTTDQPKINENVDKIGEEPCNSSENVGNTGGDSKESESEPPSVKNISNSDDKSNETNAEQAGDGPIAQTSSESTVKEDTVAKDVPVESALSDKKEEPKATDEPDEEEIDSLTLDTCIDDALFFC